MEEGGSMMLPVYMGKAADFDISFEEVDSWE